MFKKVFLAFLFLNLVDFVVNDDDLSEFGSPVWGPPLTHKELYFYKDKQTDGTLFKF